MPTVFEIKEQAVTDTPLLLIDCTLKDGRVERWSTHKVETEGDTYEARILRHNVFEAQTAADLGIDAIPRVILTIANADSHCSQIERAVGWKGSRLRVRFGFFDLRTGDATTELSTVFQGITNPPDEITESTFRLSAANRMNMQRVALPQVRLQRRCPWDFPATLEQRQEGITGKTQGRYSRFFRCGYSPDVEGGAGNLNGAQPFTSCRYTRADCEARGMFRADANGRETRRFGGCEFVPPSIQVRSYGERGEHASAVIGSEGRYNDSVPLVYGTAWYTPPVVFARNDGNLTHMEVLLGMGEIEGVLKVLVNDVEIAEGRAGAKMSGTGWFNLVSHGNRTGSFNPGYVNGAGNPAGDPYGSMAYLSVVVPNRVNDGRSLPTVKVLARGLRLPRYDAAGLYLGDAYTNNPAWVLLDILMRCGWSADDVDLCSFGAAAAYCEEQIAAEDPFQNPITTARFQCNLAVQKRRSAADLIRGIRNGARLFLTYGVDSKLQLSVENTIEAQQPEKPAWSNASQTLDGGWPSYEFDERSIMRRGNGEASVRVWSRPTGDTPNRFSIEFQDELNEFQQDSFSLVDVGDIASAGQEVSAILPALGIANFDQAGRILKYNLDRSVQGNTYIEFETSVKAIGIRPGDLITVEYLKEGFARQAFRVLRISAAKSYGTFRIMAQIHRDDWYADTNGQAQAAAGARRQPNARVGVPRPLAGNRADESGRLQYEISESIHERADGGAVVQLATGFAVPRRPSPEGPGIPLLNLAPEVETARGTLKGNQTLYYTVTGVDGNDNESPPSFVVRAAIPGSTNSNSVILKRLSFSPETASFHVYRGFTPDGMRRIATNQALSTEFADDGLAERAEVPADPNFDRANFYWRFETAPEMSSTVHGDRTIGNESLALEPNEWRGMIVRIESGRGAGQERAIEQNTASVLTLDRAWEIEPDASSRFIVSEAGWRFGATTQTSPVEFEIPNRAGAVIHVCGRAANVMNVEAPHELSTVTRWMIGGGGALDDAPPARPSFGLGLSPVVAGAVEVSGIAFSDLANTRTISAATMTLFYWSELSDTPAPQLTITIEAEGEHLDLDAAIPVTPGSIVQVGQELMKIEEVLEGGSYRVSRAVHGSDASTHDAGELVYALERKIEIMAFPRDFFGSPASGAWKHTITLPDARIGSAELYVTNSKGESEVALLCLTGTLDGGLRTLSGGQISFQIDGFLAVENGAAPDFYVDASHAVRNIFAMLRQPPSGSPLELRIKQDDNEYCTLSILPGATMSEVRDGFSLGPIRRDSRLVLDVVAAGIDTPGADLTVVIQL
jgi:hypothetical protein